MLRRSRLALIVPLLAALMFAFSQPPAGATFPGKNGKIAFDDYVGSEHIFTVNPDGSGAIDLTPGFEAGSPGWSPDGTKIAFESFLGPPSNGIWVMNADGSNKRQLTDDGGYAPSYSPDGSHIVYICCPSEGLVVMRADGSHRRTIIRQRSPSEPEFSPDGTTIAYAQGSDIWVVSRDGSNRHRLTKGFPADESPSWSPDGTRIAFHRSSTGPHFEDVWIMNADGTNLTNVTENLVDGTVFIEPAWSPDGTKLVMTRYPDCYGGGLITINLDGTDLTSVFCLYDAHHSVWQSLPAGQPSS